jgi:hypothetical protein
MWCAARPPVDVRLQCAGARADHLPGLVEPVLVASPIFAPIFITARLPGWKAHIAEQLTVNSLIRPLAAYDGPAERHLGQ